MGDASEAPVQRSEVQRVGHGLVARKTQAFPERVMASVMAVCCELNHRLHFKLD